MSPTTPRLNAACFWECPVCKRAYPHPEAAARCHSGPRQCPPTLTAPLVRCSELPTLEGHLLTLTGWLEADQAELTLLHRKEDGALNTTPYRFCAPQDSLEPTGHYALLTAPK